MFECGMGMEKQISYFCGSREYKAKISVIHRSDEYMQVEILIGGFRYLVYMILEFEYPSQKNWIIVVSIGTKVGELITLRGYEGMSSYSLEGELAGKFVDTNEREMLKTVIDRMLNTQKGESKCGATAWK